MTALTTRSSKIPRAARLLPDAAPSPILIASIAFPALAYLLGSLMHLHQFKALFELIPEKYPFQMERRHPAVLEKLITHWEVPIEMESLFARILGSSAKLGPNGLPGDALAEMDVLRDVYRSWREERRPRAAIATLRALAADNVPGILKTLRAPTPDVLASMRKATELVHKDSPLVGAFLLNEGLGVDQRDADGLTCLMACSQRGAEKAAVALLKAGANPHMADVLGNTALHWAVLQNKRRQAEMLLYFGADPNAHNAAGATPFSLCAIKDDSSLAQRLYEYGADLSAQDALGNTPLHKAVAAGSIENTWLLLVAGARGFARNKAGLTPRDLAEKNPEILRVWDMQHVESRQSAL